jgi:hypothetical protein
LLRVIARLPNGAVVLPGLDTAMSEYAWSALDDAHPQAGLARLLQGLGAARGDVRAWPAAAPDAATAARGAMLSQALLPADALAEWRNPDQSAIDGLMLVSPADQQEESSAIAMVLREALETPGATAALVTPDRALARLTDLPDEAVVDRQTLRDLGTGSMTVPIATSPGRGGFGPQLALSYDSGAGNGPFGLGWSLGLPQIKAAILVQHGELALRMKRLLASDRIDYDGRVPLHPEQVH